MHRDRSYGSLAGKAASIVYSHAADAVEGFPCRCVNGCPAAFDSGIAASVLSVDSTSRSGVSREFRVVRECSMHCDFFIPLFWHEVFATRLAYYVLRRWRYEFFTTRSAEYVQRNCDSVTSDNSFRIIYSAKVRFCDFQ